MAAALVDAYLQEACFWPHALPAATHPTLRGRHEAGKKRRRPDLPPQIWQWWWLMTQLRQVKQVRDGAC